MNDWQSRFEAMRDSYDRLFQEASGLESTNTALRARVEALEKALAGVVAALRIPASESLAVAIRHALTALGETPPEEGE